MEPTDLLVVQQQLLLEQSAQRVLQELQPLLIAVRLLLQYLILFLSKDQLAL
jgi:hypothetical protein